MYTEYGSDGIKPGENYAIWRTPRLTPNEFGSLSAADRLIHLVTIGSLAPSTHNTQPWFYQLNPDQDQINVQLDKERVLPASDRVGRQACISIGCTTAFLEIAAQYFGYPLTVKFEKIAPAIVKPGLKPARFIPAVTISLAREQGESLAERPFYEAIFTRRMNRGLYNSQIQIENGLLDQIKASVPDNQATVHLVSRQNIFGGKRMAAFAEIQGQADSFVVGDPKFTGELGEWLYPNDTESFLGMPGDTFGAQDEQAERYHNGLKGELELSVDEKAGLAGAGRNGINSAYLVGMITVKKDIPENWIKAGMTLGRTALLFESHGLAMAVHAGPAEVPFVDRGVQIALGILGSKDKPVILFRAGSPTIKSPHAPRLPIKEIIDIF